VATSFVFMPIIASNARFALPGDAPLVFAPAALALLAAIADDGVPVTVGLLLIVSGDLKREGFIMLECGTAVKADTSALPPKADMSSVGINVC
jgi:hypothetical protein